MVTPNKFLTFAFLAVSAISALITFATVANAAGVDHSANKFIPEYYFKDSGHVSCTLRLGLREGDFSKRKKTTLAIVDGTYRATKHWSQDFILAGLDYVSFRYMHFISYKNCDQSLDIISAIDSQFGVERSDWAMEAKSDLVTSAKELETLGPLGIFIRYYSRGAVRSCLMQIQLLYNAQSTGSGHDVLNALAIVRMKYRLPIADVSLINDRLYVLYSRDCSKKLSLYGEVINVLERENVSTNMFGNKNLNPDPDEYLFVRLGSQAASKTRK